MHSSIYPTQKYGRAVHNSLHREKVRKHIIQVIFIIYWLVIFEGALRKWVFPTGADILFFIRAPFALYVYALVLYYKLWPRTSAPLLAAYLLAIASFFLLPIQFIQGGYGLKYLILWGYGWHNTFFYIPLAFIIGKLFTQEDVFRFFRHTLWLAVIAVPLVMLQFSTPPDSIFNQGSGLDEDTQFRSMQVALGVVRTSGFFTSTLGQTLFLGAVTWILAALWLLPKQDTIPRRLLWLATFAAFIMLAMSGSRTAFVLAGGIVVSAGLTSWLTGSVRMLVRGMVIPLLLTIFITAFPLVFPSAFDVFIARWTNAAAAESHAFELGVAGRALYGLYGFTYYLADAPIAGYLMGFGGNAAKQITWVNLPAAAQNWNGYGGWGEDAWSRHIIELGPVFGLLFIIYRIGLGIWLLKKALHSLKKLNNPLALLLLPYTIALTWLFQIGHGSVLGFVWIFVGIVLAACKMDFRK